MNINNDAPAGNPADMHAAPDAHGEAALLLVESLIHGLVAAHTLTIREAVEIVSVADHARTEIADDRGDDPSGAQRSVALLTSIEASLRQDLPRRH